MPLWCLIQWYHRRVDGLSDVNAVVKNRHPTAIFIGCPKRGRCRMAQLSVTLEEFIDGPIDFDKGVAPNLAPAPKQPVPPRKLDL
jgi:hypothetical protein